MKDDILAHMKTITQRDLHALVRQARKSLRRRAHLLLHKHSDPVLKLIMAMEPDSYAPPNKHPGPDCQELFIALQGRFAVILFDAKGVVVDHNVIGKNEEVMMVEVPVNVWHTIISLKSGSISMEVIKGPYKTSTFKHIAPWAPQETDRTRLAYNKKLLKHCTIT